jgi:hypothetical protein
MPNGTIAKRSIDPPSRDSGSAAKPQGGFMPHIMSPTLSIEVIGTSAQLTIDLDVAWETWEQLPGQAYLLQAEMWGRDGTFLDPDNRLFTIGRPFVTSGAATQHVSVDTRVPLRDLDEDSGDDEVYARLRISPTRSFGSATARTNTVTGNFDP